MYALTFFFVFALGAVIGSFLNVVILRTGTGLGLLRGSFCFTCRAVLRFYELVPIFSFLALRGRCRSCRAKIHFQYPLVETLAGLLFLGVWLREMGGATLFDLFLQAGAYERILPHLVLLWTIVSILLAIAVYDIRHKIIPNAFVYTFIALSFLSLFGLWALGFGLWIPLEHLIAGVTFFILFAALWFVSRGTWMGLGDAKLAAGIGLFLGISSGGAALVLSFWSGALLSVALLFLKRFHTLFGGLKNLTIKSEIPFAPFLIFGTFLAYFLQISFWDIASIFAL
ncbi:MAG: hypothetical protein A3D67_01890 [Candidatus Lloydbacteria bacterium RIFCSPHIGHO2_02_FULL_51_22]|uniref:Prepilin peptidase n=2 Tax=Candidatus Lloydiibacteriota TaxID=1817910 RepID=A0A1G2DAD2_9BACT|nr:MAG: hypothetical protein A3D67_01890 [Candidatus Lloydbacteria bacterium RIFCSPHIGHO2_02_FULL_51_22]OGZ15567.1 MAG: hypothetical protein A3J08_01240 [Candidatus Lloydbacteria bacterium RIFCSPLOWO2_02_FULL_51_11]